MEMSDRSKYPHRDEPQGSSEGTQKTSALKPEILFENPEIIAVSKPSGLLTLPDRFDALQNSLRGMLAERYGEAYTIHRLDRDTSGLIIFARTLDAQRHYTGLFEERKVEKTYLGLVQGRMPEASGTLDQPMGQHPHIKGRMAVVRKGKYAITHYAVEENIGRYSLLSFRIETGRTHQIRVHMQHAGHPIACDPIYGTPEPILLSSIKRNFNLSRTEESERPLLDRLALHAWKLSITDMQGETMTLEAPLPKDMQACLKQLRKWTR